MSRTIIIGGGVIGLSIAYELSSRGGEVVVVEQREFGRQASWAGAGMLPVANEQTAVHPLEHLQALSNRVHQTWATRLLEETGIDNQLTQCGGLYLARTAGEIASLIGASTEWAEQEIAFTQIDDASFDQFPAYRHAVESIPRWAAVSVPDESQFCNPRQIDALMAACEKQNVELQSNVGSLELSFESGRIVLVSNIDQQWAGEQFILAAGPWTQDLAGQLNVSLPMQPVRGQMALFKIDAEIHSAISQGPIVYEGSRYLVPRRDGFVLAGSTIEEVGFDNQTTPQEVTDVRRWANSITSVLDDKSFVKAWAGLRPATYDGFPYLGRLPGFENGFVATGHFKSGLQLSTGTALVIADLVAGQTPTIDLTPFDPGRAN